MAVKVVHERFKCIGCGVCASLCSQHWEMGEDGKSVLKNGKDVGNDTFELELPEEGCNLDAAQGCPVRCIHIIKDGKQII